VIPYPFRTFSWVLFAALLVPSVSWGANKKPNAPAEAASRAGASQVAELRIAYLSRPRAQTEFPYFDPPASDLGLQGARLAIEDNNTTGRFVAQRFTLRSETLGEGRDAVDVVRQLATDGYRYVLVDLPVEELQRLAVSESARQSLIFDVASVDDALRGNACSRHVVHLLPDRSMRADALAQYLAKKRWNRWFLIVGREPGDHAFAAAVERAAKRFGGKIVASKEWSYAYDDRRTPESEVPVFTQGDDYDVLWVVDEAGSFGDLLAYRSWLPRPVVGTQGLVATAWHRTHEAWGALQLQNRFKQQSGRWMQEVDYAAWLAIRAIGEAATRTKGVDFDAISAYVRGDQLALAGFKGVPLSFRSWDGQLRQPVLLAQERSMVAVAPIEGFIHPTNELDTLGYDRSESNCHADVAR
jgi:ABC transporter substrate binding protein (PQQ-dependent alcohol dehydrogenase system)